MTAPRRALRPLRDAPGTGLAFGERRRGRRTPSTGGVPEGRQPRRRFRLLAAFAAALLPAAAGADGTATSPFLKLAVGGRGAAMGEAQTAAVNDATAIHWNPAGLGELAQNEVAFMRNNFFEGITQDTLDYVHPTAKGGTWGLGLTARRVADIDGYDTAGIRTNTLTASDTLFTVGWGRSWEKFGWLPGLDTGLNVKFLQKKLGGDSATAYLADLGTLYETQGGLLRRLRTGLAVQNLGSSVTFDQSSDAPRLTKLGFAYPFLADNLTAALDLVSASDSGLSFNLGFDYRLWDLLGFRLGYKGQNDLGNGVTYGVSLGNDRLHLDYAFLGYGDLGNSHRVSLGVRFGQTFRRTQVQNQLRRAYEGAESRYAQGQWVDAYLQASQIMDVAPWHRPSRTLLRRVQQDAREVTDPAKRDKLQNQLDEHFARGVQHVEVDELIPAKREFEAILALRPDYAGAKTYLKRIDERFLSIVQNFYETGMRYFASGDYKQAKDYFEKVLVVDPNHAEAREQLTRTEKLFSQTEKAAEDRARMETIRPVYFAALTAFEKRDYEEALRKFDEMIRLDPENNEAQRYRLLCRDLLAKQAFDAGNKAAQEGDWPAASAAFNRALGYKPDYQEARDAIGKVGSQLGEQKKVESQRLYKQGLEAFLAGDQRKATELWQTAVEMDPDNLEAKRGLERVTQRRAP